jgi:hypothetical protein
MVERLKHHGQYLVLKFSTKKERNERNFFLISFQSYEVFDASSNALKDGRVYTGTIKHRTLSTNDELKVALVEFKTNTCTNIKIHSYTNLKFDYYRYMGFC